MPEEYLNCKASYMKKGVSEKTASARCAAAYFNRHGITVNEAHKRGLAMYPELQGMDENSFALTKLILTNLDDIENQTSAMKPDTHGEELEISALNMDALDEFNILEIVATKVGANAFTGNGQVVSWTERALKKVAPTWILGNVSVNHNGKFYGKIISSFFENGLVKMVVKVNDQLKAWIKKFGKDVGVSIEAISVKLNKKFEVTDAKGTGVTFVFPPETPACDVTEGCGIVATETKEDKKISDDDIEEESTVEGVVISKPINLFDSNAYSDVTMNTNTDWTLIVAPSNINEDTKIKGEIAMEDINWSEFALATTFDKLSEFGKANLLTEIDGAKLSYQERQNLPDTAFCGPGRSFPAQDAAHVRNGLARLSQAKGLSTSQKAAIHSCLASRAKKYGIDVASTVVEEVKGETMVEEKPAETICAKKHETLMKEKDSVIEVKVKEIESLKATVAKFEAEHKTKVLEAFVKETGLDAKAYESKEVSVLEDIMATLKAVKEKEAKEPVVDSGAIVTATKQETKKEGDVITATISEAEQKAKTDEELRAKLFAKAEKIDGIKR